MTLHARRAAATALTLAALFGVGATTACAAQADDFVFSGSGRTLPAATQLADLAASGAGYNPALCRQVAQPERSGWTVTLYCAD
ncbi:hypothetical protein GCM10009665_05500 [Kitasatospora nipponensis]|uniref:Secreted protein n=1 Tax=Kitasatospora nipponensis TaxID=258049 RepID=A0ABN1VQY4_9ACTN